MKSDLEELIEAYEMEKAELEKQISGYVSEGDYLYAHQHQKGLGKLNGVLSVLKGLQNPLYKSISDEEYKLSNIKNLINHPAFMASNGFLENLIRESETKIFNLQCEVIKPGYDSQEVDDAVFSLVEGTVRGFKLYFKTSPDVFVSFALVGGAIEIRLQHETEGNDEYQYIFKNINKFKSLGFQLEDIYWVYYYPLNKFKDALEIKTMLARLIYDVFYYDRRYDTAKIVYAS